MQDNKMTSKVITWGGFATSLIAIMIAAMSYYSTEKKSDQNSEVESARLQNEAMDLLLFEPVSAGTLAWNFERGKVITKKQDRRRLEDARRKISELKIIDPENEYLPALNFSYLVQYGEFDSALEVLSADFGSKERLELILLAAMFNANVKNSMDAAQPYFKIAVNEYPEDPAVHYLYGVVLHSFNQNRGAIVQLKKSLILDPGNVRLANALAHVYSESEQQDKAERILLDLIFINKADAMTYNNLGSIRFYSGRLELAREAFLTAIKLSGEKDGVFLHNLSVTYQKAGNKESAEKYKLLAEQDPSLPKYIIESDEVWL